MICPRCMKDDTTSVGGTHYICNDITCLNEDGSRTQFSFVEDEYIRFPYNVIFNTRNKNEFFRKPYLQLNAIGSKSI